MESNVSEIFITQNLPALYTIDGRQYEMKNIVKTVSIAPADLRPLTSYIPSVVSGSPDGTVVPVAQNDYNIFLNTQNAIIPLKWINIFSDAGGNTLNSISTYYYTWFNQLAQQNLMLKTTRAQSKIQYLMSSNNFPAQTMPFDFKIFKTDFVLLENGERILFTNQEPATLSPFIAGFNEFIWNQTGPFAAGLQFYNSMSFTYLELL